MGGMIKAKWLYANAILGVVLGLLPHLSYGVTITAQCIVEQDRYSSNGNLIYNYIPWPCDNWVYGSGYPINQNNVSNHNDQWGYNDFYETCCQSPAQVAVLQAAANAAAAQAALAVQQRALFGSLPAPNVSNKTPYTVSAPFITGAITKAYLPGSNVSGAITNPLATIPGSQINSPITNSAATIPGANINSPITNSAATIPGANINSPITNSAATIPGANTRGALYTGSVGGASGAATVTGGQVTSAVASASTASSIACSNSGGSVTATVYLGGVGVNSSGSGSAAVPSQLHTVAYGGTLCPGQYSVSASCGPGFNTSWNCGGSSCGWSINLTGYSGNIISNSYGHSGCQYNHANGYGYQNVCQNTSNFSMWTETNTLDTHSSPGGLGNVNWNLQDNVSGGVNNGTACTVTATLITQYPY
jgi:hypothetical protein